MRNFEDQRSDAQKYRLQKIAILAVRRSIQTNILLYLLLVGLVPLVFSCKQSSLDIEKIEEKPVVVDSVLRKIVLCADSEYKKPEKIDLLIYEDKDLYSIVEHIVIKDELDSIEVKMPEGSHIYVLIANYPSALPKASVQRYETISKLRIDYRELDERQPIMSAWGKSDKQRVELKLSPLISRVEILSVSNLLDDYELLESPRLRLLNANASACLLQNDPFSPSETIDYGEWIELPCDVGTYTQKPNIKLYCLPSSDLYSALCTELELECYIKGKKCSFTEPLPSLTRNGCTQIEICVDSPSSCDFRIL